MLDVRPQIQEELGKVLTTYPEIYTQPASSLPCLTYAEEINADDLEHTCEVAGYSRVGYIVKAWGHDFASLLPYCLAADAKMRGLGFKRTASNTIIIDDLIQIAMNYEALGYEQFT